MGDKAIVETADWYDVYRVEEAYQHSPKSRAYRVVRPRHAEVIAPVPDHSGQQPT